MEIEFVCAGCGEECLICDLETDVTLTHCTECANKRIEELEEESRFKGQMCDDWRERSDSIEAELNELQRKYEATRKGLEEALYMLGVIDLDGNVTPEYQDPDPDAMKLGVRRAIRAFLENDDD